MSQTYDVVIIGGGIVGSSIAYALAANPDFQGSILVLERDSSYKNASTPYATGVIRNQFSTPENILMSAYGISFLRDAAELLFVDAEVDVGFREHPYMILADNALYLRLRQGLATQHEYSADVRALGADEIADEWPLITTTDLAAGFLSRSGAGFFDPWMLLSALKRKARSLGVTFSYQEANSLVQSNGRVTTVLTTDGKTISTDFVVNAAGVTGAREVCSWLGIEIPLEPRVRTTISVACEPDISNLPMLIFPNGMWMKPEGAHGFLCGGTPPPDQDAPTFEFITDNSIFEDVLWPTLYEYIPAFEALKVTSMFCGHYDYNTLDENAIIGALPAIDNVVVATGFSGHGAMHAPATGLAIAELVAYGEYRTLDLRRYSIDRIFQHAPIKELNVF